MGFIQAARNSCLKPREAWEMRVACGGAQHWTAQGPCSGVSCPPRAWEQAPAPLGPAGLRHGFVQGEVGLPSLPLIWLCGFQGEAMFTARNLTGCTRGWESHVHQLRSQPESTRV